MGKKKKSVKQLERSIERAALSFAGIVFLKLLGAVVKENEAQAKKTGTYIPYEEVK